MLVFLKAASTDVIHQLISEANKPMFGHFIFSSLKVAANENLKELRCDYYIYILAISPFMLYALRLTALDCLSEAISFPYELLPKILTGYFPGICTNMLKIIDGNVKQSYSVTQVCLSYFFITYFTHFIPHNFLESHWRLFSGDSGGIK